MQVKLKNNNNNNDNNNKICRAPNAMLRTYEVTFVSQMSYESLLVNSFVFVIRYDWDKMTKTDRDT